MWSCERRFECSEVEIAVCLGDTGGPFADRVLEETIRLHHALGFERTLNLAVAHDRAERRTVVFGRPHFEYGIGLALCEIGTVLDQITQHIRLLGGSELL